MPQRLLGLFAAAALMLAAAGSVFAQSAPAQRYANALTPLLDAAGGKKIGNVAPGAAVTVEGTSGGSTHVTIKGFSPQSSAATVFTSADKHIIEISGFSGHATAGASQSSGGTAYTAVTVDGWVATSALADNLQSVLSAGAALFSAKCGSCHALPKTGDYNANQWPGIMKTQSDNAALDDAQAALITTYLQIQSGK